jgi:hypothetical protein
MRFPMPSSRRRFVPCLLLLGGSLLLASAGSAQLRVIPNVGMYLSPSNLGTAQDDIFRPNSVGRREAAFAYGLTLAYVGEGRLDVRLAGAVGYRSRIHNQPMHVRPHVLWAGVGFRPWGRSGGVQPYLFGGGGLKRFSFAYSDGSPVGPQFSRDYLATGVLGIGIGRELGPVTLTLELADHMSRSALRGGDRQHDLFLTLGLVSRRLGLGG